MAKIASCAEFLKHQRAGPQPVRHAGAGMQPTRQTVPVARPWPRPAPANAPGHGTVTQWIGPPASRKVDAAMALLLAAAEDGLGCAWVEARGGFSCPARIAPPGWAWHRTGIYAAYALSQPAVSSGNAALPCRLAVNGFGSGHSLLRKDGRRRCVAAIHATVQLLRQRRWAVVVLHLGGVPPAVVQEIAPSLLAWLQRVAVHSGAALVLLGERVTLDLSGGSPGAAGSVLHFEARRLRSAHGLRRRPQTEGGSPALHRLRRGQGREAPGRRPNSPSTFAPASSQAVAAGAPRPPYLQAIKPFLVR